MSQRILLVDDDELLRDLLEMTLALEGYEIGVASNGAEALTLLENAEFHLIVLDLMMPILDGMR
ncbi:MAG: response regulator, partial [Acidobacteria bacterium]|nr:response regulator [Acidobacteriota bacterium]